MQAVRRALVLAVVAACSSIPSPPKRPPTKATAEQEARATQLLTGPDWYRHAVFYEAFVRSFADSAGDGIGDFDGLTGKLDYVKGLGVDAVWLMPIMPTPFKDSGYDVADYRAINPEYGDMAAFDRFLTEAHRRNVRVLVDLVLNHTASTHAWFRDSRASKTGPKADWYVWSDTPSRADIGCGTAGPPFGDSAWTFEPARGQYYFHRFYPEQPDLNYRNPEVVAETLDIAKFWLDKGVDGFRCDVIGMLFETATQCDLVPETVDYIRKLRAVTDSHPDRAMVAESSLASPVAYFGSGKDMFHMAFDFSYGYLGWNVAFASRTRNLVFKAIQDTAAFPASAQDATLIGSHDVGRAFARALGDPSRQRRAAEIAMFMKGSPFVYYGEELGLHPGTDVVVDSRDSARTPMPWTNAPGHGFSTGKPWIGFGDAADQTNVEAEDADPNSMLTFYRSLLAFRRGHSVWGTGDMRLVDIDNPAILAFVRRNNEEAYLVLASVADDPQEGAGSATDIRPGDLVWGNGTAVVSEGVEGATLRVTLPASGSAVIRLR